MSRRNFISVLVLQILCCCLPGTSQSQGPVLDSADLPPAAVRQIEALMAEKANRTPAQQKISSHLLHEARVRRGETIADGVPTKRTDASVGPDGLVEVDIRTGVTAALQQRIVQLGGRIVSTVPARQAIRARVPLANIEAIAALPEVIRIRPADRWFTRRPQSSAALLRTALADSPIPRKVNTSEGDTAHRAALARSLYGVTGSGIGIGVLSDGVDSLADRQATGDLPNVTVLSGQAGIGNEGTAMLEIAYDLAPGARLFFATADGGQAQLATNIGALCDAGANIIVDDVGYFTEAVFQDGIVAQGVNSAVGKGCFYFSAAGNEGSVDHGTAGVWEGDFVAAGTTPPGTVAGVAHDFGGGKNSDQVTASGADFVLEWSDPLGGSANDYDLYLFDSTLTTVLDFSTDVQTGTQDPVESICSGACNFNDTGNRLVIVKYSGSGRYLHLTTFGGQLATATTGQIGGHPAAENAFAVAAVNVATAGGGAFTGGSANPVENYSSDGLRRIFFNADGTAITPGDFSSTGGRVVQKPDIAAADCVTTATPGFTRFCGTSAAAPHAAAIAALMLQARGGPSSMTLSDMRNAMAGRALDIEAPGTDRDSGAGIFDALGIVGRIHPLFTDSPLTPGVTVIRAVHLTELRNRIDAQRQRCGLALFSWTDSPPTAGMTLIKAVHISEMRTALNDAYTACHISPLPTYTDSSIVVNSTVVKASHITELRNAVIAIE
jgi:hypothetical protein